MSSVIETKNVAYKCQTYSRLTVLEALPFIRDILNTNDSEHLFGIIMSKQFTGGITSNKDIVRIPRI